jgi:hypothetical protein
LACSVGAQRNDIAVEQGGAVAGTTNNHSFKDLAIVTAIVCILGACNTEYRKCINGCIWSRDSTKNSDVAGVVEVLSIEPCQGNCYQSGDRIKAQANIINLKWESLLLGVSDVEFKAYSTAKDLDNLIAVGKRHVALFWSYQDQAMCSDLAPISKVYSTDTTPHNGEINFVFMAELRDDDTYVERDKVFTLDQFKTWCAEAVDWQKSINDYPHKFSATSNSALCSSH